MRKVYQFEYNISMGNTVYLPLASGLLRSYAKTDVRIAANYQFTPFQFVKTTPENSCKDINDFDVLVVSLSMWNFQYGLAVVQILKKKNPNALVIAGGPSVPFEGINFLTSYPFVDVSVRGEGERTLNELLLAHLDKSDDFSEIKGISYRTRSGQIIHNRQEQIPLDLNTVPSPYLEGEYEYLYSETTPLVYQAIIETNRGCPFNCGFCFWGHGGLNKKLRQFPIARVKADADWVGAHRIAYTFCADSNFGIIQRDIDIARYFTQVKERTSFPEKFRVCYAKNSLDRVEEIAKIFNAASMDKSITLSFQTKNDSALANIGRKNIRQEDFMRLQKKYCDQGIPVYSELILGLPGETYASFLAGIEEILRSGLHNKLFIYLCQVYPNTMIGDPAYQEKHGIKILSIPLTEIHCSIHSPNAVCEFEDIIIETATLNYHELMRLLVNAILIQLFFSLGLLYRIMVYWQNTLNIRLIEFIDYVTHPEISKKYPQNLIVQEVQKLFIYTENLKNTGRGVVALQYGEIYWEPEEVAFLVLMEADKNKLIQDIFELTKAFMSEKKYHCDTQLLFELITYQIILLPGLNDQQCEYDFNYDFLAYFSNNSAELFKSCQHAIITPKFDFNGSQAQMAKQLVLYGRKGAGNQNTMVIQNNINH
jgi:hypothetical protein